MAISKKALREWPHNNRPSKRHVWFVVSQNVDGCKRCGTRFHRIADGPSGAVYCVPTPQWLADNPTDDGMAGEVRSMCDVRR
jgi:hypothetical protein